MTKSVETNRINFARVIPASQYPTVFYGTYTIPDSSKPYCTYIHRPIEWFVLEQDLRRGRVLLLSKHILSWEGFANSPIFGSGYQTSWETSYLRYWLNNTFCSDAFSPEEQARLVTVNHAASSIDAPSTAERLFLLSADEVREYFPVPETAAALEPIVDSLSSGGEDDPIEVIYWPAFWWTRTIGKKDHQIVCVDTAGSLREMDSNCDEIGVRPAMWVRL